MSTQRRTVRASLPWRWHTLVFLVSLGVAISTRARADLVRAHLAWQRPVGSMCPSSATLQADVEQLMGRAVFAPEQDADLLVRGVAEDGASGVRIRIDVRDASGSLLGTRELSAASGECASLRRALGVVLTLLLDQDDFVPRAAADARRRRVSFGASLGVLTATLPRADAGFGLALSLAAPASTRVRVDASYWLPVVAETQRGVGARFQAVFAGLSVCPPLLSTPRVGLWLCAGAELGGLRATPRQLTGLAYQTRLLVQPTVELVLALRVSRRSSLEASLGALANTLRPRFSYQRGDGQLVSVYRPGIFGALLRIGLTME